MRMCVVNGLLQIVDVQIVVLQTMSGHGDFCTDDALVCVRVCAGDFIFFPCAHRIYLLI